MSVYIHLAIDQNSLVLKASDAFVDVSYDLDAQSIVLSAEYKSIYQLAYLQLIQDYVYLSSINTKTADLLGTILLLGSECISIVDHTDTTNEDESDSENVVPNQHTIKIFDGCRPCNDCDAVWLVIQALLLLHIWVIGLKDCVLHYLPTASALWTKLTADRTGVVSDDMGLCSYTSQLPTRQQAFGRATKLLYQYKAAVAMWNYLVYNLSSRVNIQATLLDYTGFSIKIKRRFNLCTCGNNASSPVLKIQLKRLSGQPTYGLIIRHTEPVSDSTTQPQFLVSSVPYALGFYVDVVPLNTYILTHTDKGGFSLHNTSIQHYTDGGQIEHVLQPITYGDTPTVGSTITYNISGTGQYVCSALLKLIPVMLSGDIDISSTGSGLDIVYTATLSDVESPSTSLTLALYVLYRKRNSLLSDSQLTLTNRWLIYTSWTGGCSKLISDAAFYKTSYNLYPNIDIILGLAQSLVLLILREL